MKGRQALLLPPTFESVNDTQDAYIQPQHLRPLAKKYGRFWSFHSIPTTVALPGNRYAKSLKGFTSHQNETDFRELLREYSALGCPRPSGYADVFHDRFVSPRVHWSVNALLAPAFAGGWQSAIRVGGFPGIYRKYDMQSAYLWAATLGLPDTRTYTRSLRPNFGKHDGIFRIQLIAPSIGAPFPFNRAVECLASNLEIETYNLRIGKIIDGVVWKNTLAADSLLKAMRAVSTWKQAGRMYWGRWAQMQRIECAANGKRWNIPNLALNIPWAHLIVSRVKMRLWENASNAVHVFVDSVITPDTLKTGTNLGDWRLEKTYQNGVLIRKPGQYGAMDSPYLDRMAGVAINSPLRQTA